MHKQITHLTQKTMLVILLLASTESLFAKKHKNINKTEDITFDTHISVSTQSMLANEYVYHPYTGDKLSQLIWDTSYLAMVGIGGSLHFQEQYTINIDYWFSTSISNSKMTDYDWFIPNYDWTHRSISENTDVSDASSFDISAQMNAYTLSGTTIDALLGYRQDTAKRKVYGGTYIYSEEEFRDTTGTIPNILAVTYTQTWKAPYLGFKTHTDITKLFTLHTKFIYAPIVIGEAIDNHHLRGKVTVDTLDNTSMYALDLGLEYKLSTALSINLNYMYQKYNLTKGDSKLTIRGGTRTYKDIAGADLETSKFSLAMSYRF